MEQYLTLLKTIKEKGSYKPAAREGMPGTLSLFGYQFRHDLSKGFPLLTTKKMFWKGVVVELLWFLRGDINIKFLDQHNVTKMWHEDAYNYYCKLASKNTDETWNNIYMPVSNSLNKRGLDLSAQEIDGYSMFTFEEFCDVIKNFTLEQLKEDFTEHNYTLGDCGFQYGRVWREWGYQAPLPLLKPAELSEEQLEKFKEEWLKQSHNLTPIVQSEQLTWMECKGPIDQIKNVIKSLKESPMGRRHVVTAWDPAHDTDLALTWCHALFQFNCRLLTDAQRADLLDQETKDKYYDDLSYLIHLADEKGIPKYYLDCQLYQRSADVVLGVPFNIASYALLTEILAKICNMIPGDFVHTFGDVHIYDNHKDAVEEQLQRELKELPKLKIVDEGNDWAAISNLDFDLIKMLDHKDFQLENYNPHPKLESETKLSTGLK